MQVFGSLVVELAFDGAVVLLFHSALRFTHLELFLVKVLVPYSPVLCFFFSPGAPAVFLKEGYAGYVTPCRVLVVVLITSFLSPVRGLEFLLFEEGAGVLL
jgi:hypothetical protein